MSWMETPNERLLKEHLRKARTCLGWGSNYLDNAIKHCMAGLKISSDNSLLYAYLGEAYRQGGELCQRQNDSDLSKESFDASKDSFEKALSLSVTSPDLVYEQFVSAFNLGKIAFVAGDYEKARGYFEKAKNTQIETFDKRITDKKEPFIKGKYLVAELGDDFSTTGKGSSIPRYLSEIAIKLGEQPAPLKDILGKPESERLEYKTDCLSRIGDKDSSLREIAKQIAAFMNSKGGDLIIGMKQVNVVNSEPSYSVIGIETDIKKLASFKGRFNSPYKCDTDGYENMLIHDVIDVYFDEEIRPLFGEYFKIEFSPYEGKKICRIWAKKNPEYGSPVFLKESYGKEPHFFIRRGCTTRELFNKDELRVYLSTRYKN